MTIEWRLVGLNLVAVVDGKNRGTVSMGGAFTDPLRPWHGRVITETCDKVSSHCTEGGAKLWVERQLGASPIPAPGAAEGAPEWTPAHQALALAEGWAIFNGNEIEADDESEAFAYDADAIDHVRKLAEAGSKLHQMAISIHDGTPAEPEETEEQAKEREYQSLRAKWAGKGGTMRDLCRAIRAGYDAEHSMDDDMLELHIDLGNRVEHIIDLAEAAGALLHAFGGDTPEFARKESADLEGALRGF